jgi:hypothetical protein
MHRRNAAKRLILIGKFDLSTYPQTLRSRQRSSFLDLREQMKMEESCEFEAFKLQADDLEDLAQSIVGRVVQARWKTGLRSQNRTMECPLPCSAADIDAEYRAQRVVALAAGFSRKPLFYC